MSQQARQANACLAAPPFSSRSPMKPTIFATLAITLIASGVAIGWFVPHGSTIQPLNPDFPTAVQEPGASAPDIPSPPRETLANTPEPRGSANRVGLSTPFNRERMLRIQSERMRHLDDLFNAEARVPTWAAKMESELMATGPEASDVAQPSYLDASCHYSTCRISASFLGGGNVDGWIDGYVQQIGSTLPKAEAFVVPKADGGSEILIYAGSRVQ